MKEKKTKGKWEFLLFEVLDAVIAMIWYKGFLFRTLPGMMFTESKRILWIMIAVSILLGTFVIYRRERTTWNGVVCLVIPFGIYTMITYWNTHPMLMKAALVGALVTGTFGSVLCLLRRIRERDRRKRRKVMKARIHKCGNFFGSSLAIAMAVVIGFLTYQIAFGVGLVNPAEVEASVGIENQQTIGDNIDTVKLLDEEKWEMLGTQKRMEVLQCVANIEATYLGLPHELNVTASNMEMSTLAYYLDTTHSIHISLEYLENLSATESLNNLCHEARHAYQHRLVDAYYSVDTEYKDLRIFQQASDFADEFNDYNGGEESFNEYYQQKCEEDARSYANAAVNDYYEKIEEYLNEDNNI